MDNQKTISEPYVDRKYLAEYFGVDIKTIINWSASHQWIMLLPSPLILESVNIGVDCTESH